MRENIEIIRERIKAASVRGGRDPGDITLLAVTKTFSPLVLREAYDAGLRSFGENRVQEAREKAPYLPQDIEWHLIGHLQGNKTRQCPGLFTWVHSVDSVDLGRELGRRYREKGLTCKVLVQVKVGEEESKSGCAPDEAGEVLGALLETGGLEPVGLMAIPPFEDDLERARGHFRALRLLRDRLSEEGFPGGSLRHLSMGMSHDFEVAIEEGATIVRIGTALFGER